MKVLSLINAVALSALLWALPATPLDPGRQALAAEAAPVGTRPAELTDKKPFKPVAEVVRKGPADATVRVTFYMFKGDHYLYDAKTSVTVSGPDGVTVGTPIKPEAHKKFDPNFGEEKIIFTGSPTFEVPLKLAPGLKGDVPLTVTVKYQGCNPAQCFFPTTEELKLTLKGDGQSAVDPGSEAPSDGEAAAAVKVAPPSVGAAPPAPGEAPAETVLTSAAEVAPLPKPEPAASTAASDAAPAAGEGSSILGVNLDLTGALESNLLLAFVVVFLAGVLTSLTPCVYPVIPITLRVLGTSRASTKMQSFSLAAVYVLGMAIIYTGLGMVAATTHQLFGAWLQHPAVISFLVVVFVALGFSMLGAFEIAIPSSVATRLQTVQGRGYPGALLAGLVSGIVVGPCSAPVLISLLAYISRTGSLGLGSALMFTYALGMGVLFLVLGTFAVSMPKSGAWMDNVKGVLALMIFALALYYARLLVDPGTHALLVGAFAVAAGTFVGAFHPLTWDDGWELKARKAAGILAVVAGLFFVFDGLLLTRGSGGLASLSRGGQTTTPSIRWVQSEEEGLARAQAEGRPVVVDFTAGWCGVCQELKHQVFADPRVVEKMQGFVPIMVDGSDNSNPEFQALMTKYQVTALPKVVFITAQGKVVEELSVTTLVSPDDFLRRMNTAAGESRTALR